MTGFLLRRPRTRGRLGWAPGRVADSLPSGTAASLVAVVPGLVLVGLMVVWAVHDGGYDEDTWYWGALLALLLAAWSALAVGRRFRPSRAAVIAAVAFAAYVAWSYISIAWAQSPGDALEGSNRALLYLLLFMLMAFLPWTAETALLALVTFVVAIGIVAVVLLVRLASADHVQALVIDGRLAAPTGYFNSTAALFTIEALTATALAARRELPSLLRGLLIAFACASLQLALIVQSRGWLFTLPLVALVAIVLVADRLRVAAAAVLPVLAVLVPLRELLHVYHSSGNAGMNHAAAKAGAISLILCAAMFAAGTLVAMGDRRLAPRRLAPGRRRALGSAVAVIAMAVAIGGGLAATHGHPFRFVSRQWHGFAHPQASSTGSHFTDVGSGRYDFWRVALDAFAAHPVGGLGQDNFADYYITRRRTGEEPQWTHSLELRLLASTGAVGFALFLTFVIAALVAAIRSRRRGAALARGVAGVALLPLAVWLIHGSIDWFWEVPALSGPAMGFLGMAAALGPPRPADAAQRSPTAARAMPRIASWAVLALAFCAALVVLAFPYLSVRELSKGFDAGARHPQAALHDLSLAADLNPLSPDPGRLAGAIALESNRFAVAERRFEQATSRERGDWFAWLGRGLAASALGDRRDAHHDFAVADSINSQQPAVVDALARVYSRRPLTPDAALGMLVVRH